MSELKLKMACVAAGVLLSMVVADIAVASDEVSEEKVNYLAIDMLSYRDAKSKARAEDKPAFFYFTAAFSGNTGVQMERTLKDSRVIKYLNQNFASATINTTDLPALAQKHDVSSAPTVVFLDSKGRTLTSIKGAMAPEKLLSIAEYVVEKAYEKIGYEDWAEKKALRAKE